MLFKPMTNDTNKNLVLFDDGCPLCTFQSRLLRWMDWFNVVRLIPLSDPLASEVAKGVDRADLIAAIHCVNPKGRTYKGARALRHLGMRMPLFFVFALALWIPGVIWLAEHAYMFVSRHRQFFGRIFGCKGACKLMPERDKSNEVSDGAEVGSDAAVKADRVDVMKP